MKNRNQLCLIIVLPSLAWCLHLMHLLPLETMLGVYGENVVTYAYYTLAGLILSVAMVVFIGLFSLWKKIKTGEKGKFQIIFTVTFWVLLLLFYICWLFFSDYNSNEIIEPSYQGDPIIFTE